MNAWLLEALNGYMHARYGALKARLFRSLPETIVELGPGTGANLRYYPKETRVVAVEPNFHMHKRLRRRALRFGLNLELHPIKAEELDLQSDSVDFVCSTLVLCTVADPGRVIAEVRRVLRPGGRFVCIEHVMAPPVSMVSTLQRVVRRPWRWLFEGCNLCNRTEVAIRGAGFRKVEIEHLVMETMFAPIRYQIAAICME
jgi:ubiquinone/menaquinone biosynthesis C-methylase UbiE